MKGKSKFVAVFELGFRQNVPSFRSAKGYSKSTKH